MMIHEAAESGEVELVLVFDQNRIVVASLPSTKLFLIIPIS